MAPERRDFVNNKILQIVALALVLGGFVILTLKDKDVTAFIGLVTPVLAALFIVGHLNDQDQQLKEISKNTNGVLTQRIKDAVGEAMAELGVGTPPSDGDDTL